MNKKKIISFAMYVCTWVLLIVSFSSFWYKVNYIQSDRQVLTKFNEERILERTPNGEYSEVEGWQNANSRIHERELYSTSVSFILLAWVQITVLLLLIALSMAGALNNIRFLPFNHVIRGLGLTAITFSLIGLFVFVGLPAAKQRDCTDQHFTLCGVADQHQLYGTYNDQIEFAPQLGWIIIIFGALFNIAGTVTSFLVRYQE
ncbi:hypothetical protein SAMD00019534_035110 [Acytostelium subglobosum LB1]|uniref:hypothetical protein n=1 Tax=Acytostelium subglobosum LB1 TaxID=1410327 RepID=UPI0006452222|nr:hypothetical protein SAMD00019534_035110 [Acytostelium subglobosum LB1]GAM20336.1 hypothetical protein SAMD00019534_035110 [Acytostelium subglobosum LB1]|eukprot:XP_012759857.1 hypothetical protein SAMD00019534_035110 [Acytostelium subglobosum LB1]